MNMNRAASRGCGGDSHRGSVNYYGRRAGKAPPHIDDSAAFRLVLATEKMTDLTNGRSRCADFRITGRFDYVVRGFQLSVCDRGTSLAWHWGVVYVNAGHVTTGESLRLLQPSAVSVGARPEMRTRSWAAAEGIEMRRFVLHPFGAGRLPTSLTARVRKSESPLRTRSGFLSRGSASC